MTNDVWVLPEGENYAVEFYDGSRWMRRASYGTLNQMKYVAREMHNGDKPVRVVQVSRYDPHPATAVVYYREEQ